MRFKDFPGFDNSIKQIAPPVITVASGISASVLINTVGMSSPNLITTFKVTYQRVVDDGKFKTTIGSLQTVNSASNPVIISNLVQSGVYIITTQGLSSLGEGNTIERIYRFEERSTEVSQQSSQKEIGQIKDAKSYLKITGGSTIDNKYTLAYRTFNSIVLPTATSTYNNNALYQRNMSKYSTAYYSFGTSILMPSLISGYEAQGAGIGFFINPDEGSGYYITIDTTGTADTKESKPVQILKVKSKQITPLATSQKGNSKTLNTILGATTYNVDVKVQIQDYAIVIKAYINNFEITATDTSTSGTYEILPPTKIVGLLGTSGTSMFDYVYAYNITAEEFDKSGSANFYKGQFSQDFIQESFGDMVYEFNNENLSTLDDDKKEDSYDEFGTVVREIAKREIKFSDRPSVPIKFTTGANNLASIASQTFNSFGGKAFVLNNSSIVVPLSDGEANDFQIYGYQIDFSGDIKYTTDILENVFVEPVIFESKWLHYEQDVKKLANWIKSRIVNKSRIIEMEVFGNPLISVGDIITVDYPYQGFTSSQKIIVVKVSHKFDGGLTTQIVGRTL